jgi:hypothetical protein
MTTICRYHKQIVPCKECAKNSDVLASLRNPTDKIKGGKGLVERPPENDTGKPSNPVLPKPPQTVSPSALPTANTPNAAVLRDEPTDEEIKTFWIDVLQNPKYHGQWAPAGSLKDIVFFARHFYNLGRQKPRHPQTGG